MIPTNDTHAALLNTRGFWGCDLYAITMVDASMIRFVAHGVGVSWNGYTWQGGGPLFSRDSTKIIRGLEADSLKVIITPKLTDLLLGIPWMAAVRNGAFDGARLELWRGHAATPGAPLVGAILRFSGAVEEVGTEDVIGVTVKSDLVKLDAPIPRAVYQPGCDRTLYDAGCGAVRATFQVTSSVAAGSTPASIKVASGALGAAGYYTGGELRLSSGANAGARRSVRLQPDAVTLELSYPLLQTVTVGDNFTLWPGCSHTTDDCTNKFNNLVHFRGEPFIPAPETAF